MNELEKQLAHLYAVEHRHRSDDVKCEKDDATGDEHYFVNSVFVETKVNKQA